jgi:heme exporter protein B
MNLLDQTWSLFKKEVLLEWRSKYAFNGVLLYVVATVFVCYISFHLMPGFERSVVSMNGKRVAEISETEKYSQGYKIVWNVLFWIIMLFASVNAVAKSFLQESRARLLYYYTIAGPQAIILSKMLYNVLLMGLISVLTLLVYFNFFPNQLGNAWFYVLVVLLGSISFSTVFTMISAIASKAGNNGTLMSILSFPVIIPVILVLVHLSKQAMDGIAIDSHVYQNIAALGAINIIVIATSLLLFPFLWRD